MDGASGDGVLNLLVVYGAPSAERRREKSACYRRHETPSVPRVCAHKKLATEIAIVTAVPRIS